MLLGGCESLLGGCVNEAEEIFLLLIKSRVAGLRELEAWREGEQLQTPVFNDSDLHPSGLLPVSVN